MTKYPMPKGMTNDEPTHLNSSTQFTFGSIANWSCFVIGYFVIRHLTQVLPSRARLDSVCFA